MMETYVECLLPPTSHHPHHYPRGQGTVRNKVALCQTVTSISKHFYVHVVVPARTIKMNCVRAPA